MWHDVNLLQVQLQWKCPWIILGSSEDTWYSYRQSYLLEDSFELSVKLYDTSAVVWSEYTN